LSRVTLDFEASHEFDIADIAESLAKLTSDDQALFFRMFTSFLYHGCRYEPCKIANQTMYIAKELDSRTIDFMTEICTDWNLSNES
jgi:hypothetical protein